MPESQSEIQIEDVLSSIRRLISQDTPPEPAAPTAPTAQLRELTAMPRLAARHVPAPGPALPEAAPEPAFEEDPVPVADAEGQDAAPGEALLLTPALRIEAEEETDLLGASGAWEEPVADIFAESDLAEDGLQETLDKEIAQLEDSIAEMEASIDAEAVEPAHSFPEDHDAPAPDRPALRSPGLFGGIPGFQRSEGPRFADAGPPPEDADIPEVEEAPFVDVPEGALDWQDDTLPAADLADLADEEWERSETPDPEPAPVLAEPPLAVPPVSADTMHGPRRLHLVDADLAKPASRPHASTYAQMVAEADLGPEDKLDREALIEGLDRDLLRDVVRAIVREELQGALGERITRNVRKLVRREILRALSSESLD